MRTFYIVTAAPESDKNGLSRAAHNRIYHNYEEACQQAKLYTAENRKPYLVMKVVAGYEPNIVLTRPISITE